MTSAAVRTPTLHLSTSAGPATAETNDVAFRMGVAAADAFRLSPVSVPAPVVTEAGQAAINAMHDYAQTHAYAEAEIRPDAVETGNELPRDVRLVLATIAVTLAAVLLVLTATGVIR